jgi:hypothetical protein
MTRAQRLRHQKGLERAEDILAKRHVNVVKSLRKFDNIKERAKGWEDVNGEGKKKKKKASAVDEADEEEAKSMKDSGWVSDEDMDDTVVSAVPAPSEVEAAKEDDAVVAAGISLPVIEDELL